MITSLYAFRNFGIAFSCWCCCFVFPSRPQVMKHVNRRRILFLFVCFSSALFFFLSLFFPFIPYKTERENLLKFLVCEESYFGASMYIKVGGSFHLDSWKRERLREKMFRFLINLSWHDLSTHAGLTHELLKRDMYRIKKLGRVITLIWCADDDWPRSLVWAA